MTDLDAAFHFHRSKLAEAEKGFDHAAIAFHTAKRSEAYRASLEAFFKKNADELKAAVDELAALLGKETHQQMVTAAKKHLGPYYRDHVAGHFLTLRAAAHPAAQEVFK